MGQQPDRQFVGVRIGDADLLADSPALIPLFYAQAGQVACATLR